MKTIKHAKMNRYMKCLNHEFSHRQGCIFTDFHVHEEVPGVQMYMRRRLPPNPSRRICRLQNRSGFFLTISESGQIVGTKNIKDAFSKFTHLFYALYFNELMNMVNHAVILR